MKKDWLRLLFIIYIFIFFFIHYYYGYWDFIFILIFLFFFIEFRWKNVTVFIFTWLVLLTYYTIKYFILFENWSLTFFAIVPLFLLFKKEYFNKISIFLASLIFIVLLAFVIFTFYKAGIFYNEPLVMNDYPYLFYRTWLVNDVLIPTYGNIIGWVPYFQAGYVELYDYPPGIFLLNFFVKIITGLSTLLSFRLLIFLSFISSIIAIFLFSYKFTNSIWVGVLTSTFWVAWRHYYFIEGATPFYFSLSFMLLSLVAYKLWYEKNNIKFFFLSSLSSGLSFLLHPEVFFHLILLIFIFHLIFFKKKKLIYFFALILISTIISSVYLAEGIKGLNYSVASWAKQSDAWGMQVFDASNAFLNDYLYESTVPFFLTIFCIPTLYLMKKGINDINKYFIVVIFLLIIIMFVMSFIQLFYPKFPINIFRAGRSSHILRIFILIFASYSLISILKALNIDKNENKLITGFIVSLLLIFLIFNFTYFYNTLTSSDYSQFKKVYWGNSFKDVYQLNFTKGIFRFEPKQGFSELINWLNNKDIKSRVLVEDSITRRLGGQVAASLPFFTNKTFIGGPYPMVQVADYDRNAYEGIFFGKNITSFTYEEFEKRLIDFNVKYIIVWSSDAIDFLSNNKNFNKIFVSSDNLFNIFEYEKINESYSYQDLDVKVELPYIKVFSNESIDKAVIKFTYDENWNSLNNIEEDNRSFIVIKNLNQSATLEYIPSLYEKISFYISIFSIIILTIIIVFKWTYPSLYQLLMKRKI